MSSREASFLAWAKSEAVASMNNDEYLYYNMVDTLLVRYTEAGGAIWLYRTPRDLVRGSNSASGAKLYIAEDVALKAGEFRYIRLGG